MSSIYLSVIFYQTHRKNARIEKPCSYSYSYTKDPERNPRLPKPLINLLGYSLKIFINTEFLFLTACQHHPLFQISRHLLSESFAMVICFLCSFLITEVLFSDVLLPNFVFFLQLSSGCLFP